MAIDQSTVNRILIINLAFIGDVLLSTPVARALREAYPRAVIDMLVIPLAVPVACGNPYIDHVMEYDKRGKHKKIGEMVRLVRRIRAGRYDLAVITNFAPRGAMLAWASGIRYRAGYDAQHGRWFLTHAASARRPEIRHEAENYLDVLKPLGIYTNDTSLTLSVSSQDFDSLHKKLQRDSSKPLVLICPVGSYPQKSWTVTGFAELIRQVTPWAECILIGGRAEAEKLAEINDAAGNLAGMLPGTLTLNELAALISEAGILVTVDTGPMHIANAVGTPVIALFGPTDPRVWGPRGPKDIVLQQPVDCAPCWGKTDCSDYRCMNLLGADEVVAAVRKLLGKE